MKNLLFLLFTLFALISFAQTKSIKQSPVLVEGSAISVGMSEERLARIDTMLTEALIASQIPGAVAFVARNGKIVYHKAFGIADTESGSVLQRDAIFRIASQTKAITATAVMMLWEEAKFSLDDPISKYIPEFNDAQVLDTVYADGTYRTIPAKTPITIRHLITHTSGLGYGAIDKDSRFIKIYEDAGITGLFSAKKTSIGEITKKLAKLPLHHHPGEKFTYSYGFDVLGYFIEIVSGMPLNEFFRTRILNPLGMDDTWFYLPKSKHNRLVSIHKKEHNKWVTYPKTFYDLDYPIKGAKRFFSGGGGLSSTAKDYAAFLQMYLNKGELNGIRILSRTTVELIMINQVSNPFGNLGAYYGLAFRVVDDKGKALGGKGSLGTFDWGGYFNTQYFANPKENIIGIIMKQTLGADSDDTAWKFRQLVGQAIDN
jgi:CubicO group peptidase (beta-lactamase class C family)